MDGSEPRDSRDSLKALRLARHWSQEELALAAGVSVRTVQRLENGARPSLETRRALAAALDVEPQVLLVDEIGDTPDPRVRWGIAGASFGYGCALLTVGAYLGFGQISGATAGYTLGALGTVTGLFCAGLGRWARPSRRSAARS